MADRRFPWILGLMLLGLSGERSAYPLPTTAAPEENSRPASPIIFIPGKCGSQIEGKFDKPSSQYEHCPLQEDWHRVWLDVWYLLMPGE